MSMYGPINLSGKDLSSYSYHKTCLLSLLDNSIFLAVKSQSDMKCTTHDTVCDGFKKYLTPPPTTFFARPHILTDAPRTL